MRILLCQDQAEDQEAADLEAAPEVEALADPAEAVSAEALAEAVSEVPEDHTDSAPGDSDREDRFSTALAQDAIIITAEVALAALRASS